MEKNPNEIPSYYAIIPANVRYNDNLKANEKLLYGEITSLSQRDGKCWASNGYFAKLYGVSNVCVSGWIKKLKENGYIDSVIIYKEGSKQILYRYLTLVNEGIKEKFNTPIKEKFKDNNININNTSNNNISKDITETGVSVIEDFEKKEITKNIDNLISGIKNNCNSLCIAYEKKRDRQFAKHILTSKDFGNFCENIGQTRIEFVKNIMIASEKIGYWKGVCSGPMSIYQNYAEVYNLAKAKSKKIQPKKDIGVITI